MGRNTLKKNTPHKTVLRRTNIKEALDVKDSKGVRSYSRGGFIRKEGKKVILGSSKLIGQRGGEKNKSHKGSRVQVLRTQTEKKKKRII